MWESRSVYPRKYFTRKRRSSSRSKYTRTSCTRSSLPAATGHVCPSSSGLVSTRVAAIRCLGPFRYRWSVGVVFQSTQRGVLPCRCLATAHKFRRYSPRAFETLIDSEEAMIPLCQCLIFDLSLTRLRLAPINHVLPQSPVQALKAKQSTPDFLAKAAKIPIPSAENRLKDRARSPWARGVVQTRVPGPEEIVGQQSARPSDLCQQTRSSPWISVRRTRHSWSPSSAYRSPQGSENAWLPDTTGDFS